MKFTLAQVKALCGGKMPHANGFHWPAVEHFNLENGVLDPFSGKNILPGPGIRVSTAVTGLNDIWLIQGMFFMKDRLARISQQPIVGAVAVTAPVVTFTMFMGMFGWNDSRTEMHGRMSDHYGGSIIDNINLSSNRFSFAKTYETRPPILYSFQRKESGVWEGRFKSEEKGVRGLARCVLTRVPYDFSMPPEF